VDLAETLPGIRSLEDLPALVAAFGSAPLWDPVPGMDDPPVVVGCRGDFAWYAVAGPRAEKSAQAFAKRMAARGRICGVVGLDPALRRLTLTVSLSGAPRLVLDLDRPDATALAMLRRLAGSAPGGAAGFAAHAVDVLGGEGVGLRFFRQFRHTLERMAAGLPGPLSAADRHALALLQLTRILFLYFVQARGWLAGNARFLADAVDRCLARKRRVHRDLLRPLFFGTLNRPAADRSRGALALGSIPFLNGGLFEPHPLERLLRRDIPNDLWRDAFDGLFERFHFTLEADACGGVAPDMLGRVFEGVMAPDERRASGTYYTPAALVRELLDQALIPLVAGRLGCSESEVERRLEDGESTSWRVVRTLRVLDPAVGSGAFLLGALERLTPPLSSNRHGPALRRQVLRRNLFGVDLNDAAVRLTELRLWLAVVAADRSDRPERVQPLPNLDCLIRQGDSLFDPAGSGSPARSRGAPAAELAALRRRIVVATGAAKRAALRELLHLEARIAESALAQAEASARASVTECLEAARSTDLFGGRRGLDRAGRARLAEHRRELRQVRALSRALARERRVPWFDYRVQFADVFAAGGFDLLVGNPPWLRAEEVPPELRRRLVGRYRWWRPGGKGYANRPDLAVAFLERSLELTRPGGMVALLVPAKVATAGYGAAMRHALAASTTLIAVADLTTDPRASFEATVYPLALVIRNSAAPSRHRVRIALGQGRSVSQSSLRGGGPWILQREPLRAALAELRGEHPTLDSVVSCHLGLKTGANRLFLNPPQVEAELLRWAVRGRDIAPFSVRRRTRLLWTHGRDGSPLPRLPPLADAYLAPHLSALRARADYAGGPPWTLFRAPAATAPHRVAWADLARVLRAVSLGAMSDTVPLNSCYVALARSDAEADRLTAWLNSSWIRAAVRAGAVPAAGGCSRYTAVTVGALPLPRGVLTDPDLSTVARLAAEGRQVQADLDDIAARHLSLNQSDRRTLLASLAGCAEDRG
jgi:N-6 DNA Methylase